MSVLHEVFMKQYSLNVIIHLKKIKMISLKKQQKRLLTQEITRKIMEYFMGLNDKNGTIVRKVAEKSSRKLVKAYTAAIKSQHKKAVKATKKYKNKESKVPAPVVYTEQTNLIAS
jgi:phage-related tail protein